MTENLKQFEKYLGENDFGFLNRVFSGGLDIYKKRLEAIGFVGKEKVLDAGCGFGQWSMALASLNEEVTGFDYSSERVMIANEISNKLNIKNVNFFKSSLENSKQKENSIDAIFCYGTIFITDIKASLTEFYRVLRPNGVLYVNANAIGWALNSWFNAPNKTSDYDPRSNVSKMFENTVLYNNGFPKREGQLIIEKKEMLDFLSSIGFVDCLIGPEGTLHINESSEKPAPFFAKEYFGFDGIYEVLAKKP